MNRVSAKSPIMNAMLFAGVLSAMMCCFGISSAFARATVFPTGTTIFNPEKAQDDVYILAVHPDHVAVMDRNGHEYNSWPVQKNNANLRARLMKNGNLLLASSYIDMSAKAALTESHPTTIREFAWDGKVVWEYTVPEGLDWHNEVIKLKNGNIMFPAYTTLPKEALAKIKDVDIPWWGALKRSQTNMRGDVVMEVNPKTGKTVSEWKTWEHLDVNMFSPMCPINDWTHMNSIQELPENKWYDSGDKRFTPGNLLLNPRNLDEFYIIDRKSGEVVWSGGHGYKTGLQHCHEPNMVEKGLPGEGNILIFDNGLFPKTRDRVGQSAVVELNPVSGEIEWMYETKGYSNMHFFSKTMGSESRLPNGNTFISEDNAGRLFEVTHDPKNPEGGEIVWEYVMPSFSQRSRIYAADYCPQMKAIKRVSKPYAVVPPSNTDFHVPGSVK
ncbi:MAG: arylsulfotransferase family protein [Desulfovibrio sp.]